MLFFVFLLKILCITVFPEVDENVILDNPYMGYQISYADEASYYNYSTYYLRSGGSCRIGETNHWMESLNWDILNPSENVYDFSMIDTLLECCKSNQKFGHLRMRNIVWEDDEPDVPAWLENEIKVTTGLTNGGAEDGVEIQYYDCSFLRRWEDLVEALRQKITDEPYINMLDIGSVGWFGEWFNNKLLKDKCAACVEFDPNKANVRVSLDTTKRIIHMFTGGKDSAFCLDSNGNEKQVFYDYKGFPNQQLLINQGELQTVRIGTRAGAGWRFDIIGDLPNSDESGFVYGILPLVEPIWKTVPQSGEFSSGIDISTYWNKTLCEVKSTHLSSAHDNHNSKPEPEEFFSEFFRLIGYRIQLDQATYEETIEAGNVLHVDLTFSNKGTSPAYKKYPLFLYIKQKKENEEDTIEYCQKFDDSEIDIRKILPDEIESISTDLLECPTGTADPVTFSLSFNVPSSMEAGSNYSLYFSFMEDVRQRPIEMALLHKDSEGRYLIGNLEITNPFSSTQSNPFQCIEETQIENIEINLSLRPSSLSSKNPPKRSIANPVQDWYVYRWGSSDDDHLVIKKDSWETYIQFDFTNYIASDDIEGIELFLSPWWSTYNYNASLQTSVFYDDWTYPFSWAERPSLTVTSYVLGDIFYKPDGIISFLIEDKDKLDLLLGQKVTLLIQSLEDDDQHNLASFSYNQGTYGPYFEIYSSSSAPFTNVGLFLLLILCSMMV